MTDREREKRDMQNMLTGLTKEQRKEKDAVIEALQRLENQEQAFSGSVSLINMYVMSELLIAGYLRMDAPAGSIFMIEGVLANIAGIFERRGEPAPAARLRKIWNAAKNRNRAPTFAEYRKRYRDKQKG